LIYRVPCKNCSSSYVGETSRKFSLSIKEHKKEVDSFTAGTQTRASRAREISVTHKSAITDHAVEENHVIDWDKAKVVDREAQRVSATDQMDKRHFGSGRHRSGMQDPTNSATHGIRRFPGHVSIQL